MGGNSSTAAVGTLTGIPGASSASMLLPGTLEALAAELKAGRAPSSTNREGGSAVALLGGRTGQKTAAPRPGLPQPDARKNAIGEQLIARTGPERTRMRPFLGLPPTVTPDGKPTSEESVYHPTLRDELGYLVYDTTKWAGLDLEANRMRENAQTFADFTPAGTVFDAEDVYRAIDAGNYGDAALQASLALLGLAVPVAGKIASKVVKEGARRALAGGPDEVLMPAVERSRIAKGPDIPDPTRGSYSADEQFYDAPALTVEQRSFETDYPGRVVADDTGRLMTDMDGRPIRTGNIAGRRNRGEPDVELSREEVSSIATGAGVPYEPIDPRLIGGDAGQFRHYIDPDTGEVVLEDIRIANNLHHLDTPRSEAHETGHLISTLAGNIPAAGLEDELEPLYSIMQTGSIWPLVRPQDRGYAGAQIERELMAEAIRAYMTAPNWFKARYPKAARRIRDYVNVNPKVNRLVHFNSLLLGTGGAGIGLGALSAEDDQREPRL